MKSLHTKLRVFLILLTLTALLSGSGCVRRRLDVRSNPPGATVYLDGKEIGRTPLSTNFDFYGKREFRLVKQGYETKTVLMPVRAPWYQWYGIDFVSEVLLPGTLTDRHHFEFDLYPEQIVPKYELVGRAEDLRRLAHSEGAVRTTESSTMIQDPAFGSGSLNQVPVTPPVQQPILAPPGGSDSYLPPRF